LALRIHFRDVVAGPFSPNIDTAAVYGSDVAADAEEPWWQRLFASEGGQSFVDDDEHVLAQVVPIRFTDSETAERVPHEARVLLVQERDRAVQVRRHVRR